MSDKIPGSPVVFRHRLPVQIRFNDIDALGHLNNTVYLQFMDLAKYKYIIERLGDSFNVERECMVVANINCDFLAPAYIDDKLEVRTATEKIGEHTLHLIQQVVDVSTGEVKASARVVMVAYDMVQHTTIAILPGWRKAFKEG